MKVFGKQEKRSGQIAKERLQVVLIHDRASVSPEVMTQLKNDIIGVISKYMEINKNEMEMSLANDSDSVALVVNIPVNSLRHSNDSFIVLGDNETAPPQAAHKSHNRANVPSRCGFFVDSFIDVAVYRSCFHLADSARVYKVRRTIYSRRSYFNSNRTRIGTCTCRGSLCR